MQVTNKVYGFAINAETYNNADEMLIDLKTRTITDLRFDDMRSKYLSKDWHGVANYSEALELLNNGYQPAVDVVKEGIDIKTNKRTVGSQKRYSFDNSVIGFQPIVPLAMQGIPNSMINMSVKQLKTKILDIYYDVDSSCYVAPETIINNGIELLKAIANLERQGYKINLFCVQMYCDKNSADVLCVKVKNSNLPIDIKRMSYPLVHPSFPRVLGFDWYSKFPLGKWRESYGTPFFFQFAEKEGRSVFKELMGKNAIYISSMAMTKEKDEYLKRALLM